MDLKIFEKMDAPELKNYIHFLLWHYRVMDAFWFLSVAKMLVSFKSHGTGILL